MFHKFNFSIGCMKSFDRPHILKLIANLFSGLALILFLLVAPGSIAQAARISKVKGKQVIIEIESSEINEGQKFFVMIEGKKKGIVLITKVAKGRALGKITKGIAAEEATLESVGKGGAGTNPSSGSAGNESEGDPADSTKRRGKGKKSNSDVNTTTFIGVLAGYAMDSQSVKDTAGNSVSMSGGGYSFKGFADLPLSGSVGAIARAGVEQVNLSGGNYTTSILYATGDILVRYSFSDSGFIPYIAAGLGIHYPLSKSSTILDVPRISSTTVFFVPSLGFNYAMSSDMILVGVVEYGLFPPSNDVSTSLITARFGAGWRF